MKQWDNLPESARFLRDKPLFRRLTKCGVSTKEFTEMLPHLHLVEKRAGDIVFNDDQNVHIVLNGRVLLRYHEEDPLEYQYIA